MRFDPIPESEERQLQTMRDAVNIMRSNVAELRARKTFLQGVRNASDAENVLPSAARIGKIGEQSLNGIRFTFSQISAETHSSCVC